MSAKPPLGWAAPSCSLHCVIQCLGLVGPVADVSGQRFVILTKSSLQIYRERHRTAPLLPFHKFPLNWKFIVKIRETQPLSAVQCIVCATLLPQSMACWFGRSACVYCHHVESVGSVILQLLCQLSRYQMAFYSLT